MVTIKKQIVPESNVRTRTFGRLNKKWYITIHETGNASRGAGAQSHANLQSNTNPRAASWHWQVDEKVAIQSYDHSVSCWAGGDGRGNGNMNSIHIEICINSDGDYLKTIENAAQLVKHIMKEENIPLANVVQHNKWSGKNCPTLLRAGNRGINWGGFLSKVNGAVVSATPKPSTVKRDYLVNGDTGDKVRELQSGLKQAGYKVSVDGIWGRETEAAVDAFQRSNNLLVDRIWGKASQAKLNAILANLNKKPVVKPAAPTKPKEESTVEKTNQPSKWAEATIKEAVKIGVTDGSNLHDPITRQEAIVLAMRAAGLAPKLK